jgi:hypothetical protein
MAGVMVRIDPHKAEARPTERLLAGDYLRELGHLRRRRRRSHALNWSGSIALERRT